MWGRIRMRSVIALLLVLPATAYAGDVRAASPPDAEGTPEVVRSHSGMLRGVRDGDVLRFRGVPYAQPPVGAQRWAPPVPVHPWPGVRSAEKSGPPCPQSGAPPQGSTDEDCLRLDITLPVAPPRREPRPIMVWLHGGGFTAGTGTEYDPQRLVTAADVVVVTVDFRLGVLGNLAVPGMTDGGSYGLQDQRAALAWVRGNARAFGGDAGNITLFGQSGGAVAACAQLTSPAARDLFQKVILQSGSCHTTLAANASGPDTPAFGPFWRPLAQAERTGVDVAGRLGCPDPATRLTCLRAVPVDRLLAESGAVTAAAYGGATLPTDPRLALSTVRGKTVLSGHTADEQRMVAGLYALLGWPITAEQYPALLATGFSAHADAVAAQYPVDAYPSAALAWAAAYTDSGFVCPQLRTNAALATHARVFGYEFADRTAPPLIPAPPGFPTGASHGSDLFYLFDVAGKPIRLDGSTYELTEQQRRLADRMIDVWSTFAWTGRPSRAEDRATWPVWRGTTSAAHLFTDDARPDLTDPAVTHHCGFWAGLR